MYFLVRSYYSVEIIDFNDREDTDNRNLNLLFTLIIQACLYEKKCGSEKSFEYINNLLDNLGLLGLIERIIDTLPTKELDTIVDELKNMNYRCILDTQKDTCYSWNQLGVNWILKWDYNAVDSFISDEFISYIQIILFCIHKIDISFVNDAISINLLISDDIGYDGVRNVYHVLRITKSTSYKSYFHHLGKIFSVLYQIISNSAIVSGDQYQKEMEVIFHNTTEETCFPLKKTIS